MSIESVLINVINVSLKRLVLAQERQNQIQILSTLIVEGGIDENLAKDQLKNILAESLRETNGKSE